MYRTVTVDKKYMVMVSEFYHDLGHAPHPSDVAARNAEHKSARTIKDDKQGFFFGNLGIMSNCQCLVLRPGIYADLAGCKESYMLWYFCISAGL